MFVSQGWMDNHWKLTDSDHLGGGPERLMADEYNDELRGNMIFGTNVRRGGGIGVDPNVTRRADLLEWALGERYQRVRTVRQ